MATTTESVVDTRQLTQPLVDLSVFKDTAADSGKCKVRKGNENIINDCLCIKRVVSCLRYYQDLNANFSEFGASKFCEFLSVEYGHYLDDMIHLTVEHNKDLEDINKALLKEEGFKHCDVNKCCLTDRHCDPADNALDSIANHTKMRDPKFLFFAETLDAIHFYLLHLFEMGLRLKKTANSNGDTDEDMDEEKISMSSVNSVDTIFTQKMVMITAKRKKLSHRFFARFRDQSNKFNIESTSDINATAIHDDGLYTFLFFTFHCFQR